MIETLGHHLTGIIAAILAAGPLFTGSWAAFTWTLQHRNERSNKEFEAYHKLIKDLVQPEKDSPTFVDRQIAAIFELRRFKFYRPVTRRILIGLRSEWATSDKRILNELDLAIKAIGGPKE